MEENKTFTISNTK